MATVNGTAGDDTIRGTINDEVINGLGGNDVIYRVVGIYIAIYGGDGDDIIRSTIVNGVTVSPATAIIDGGDGYDIVDARDVGNGIIFAAGGTPIAFIGGQQVMLQGIEEIILNRAAGIDVSLPERNPLQKISTGSGNDIVGGSGNVDVYLQGGNDTFSLGWSPDVLATGRTDAGTGTDTLIVYEPLSSEAGAGLVVDLQAQTAMGSDRVYSLIGFENVQVAYSGYGWQIFGDGGANSFSVGEYSALTRIGVMFDGRGGNDTLAGGFDDDTLIGSGGHDYVMGGAGDDTIDGGDGNDHLWGHSADGGDDGADSISGGAGGDYIQGNKGNDTLDGGDASDRIQGGQDNDLITGGSGNDSVNGNLGDDTIKGNAGNDLLRGGKGDDHIDGGDGNDILMGDLGVDTLTGGGGSDVFAFGGNASLFAGASPDVVTDFEDGTDKIGVGYRVSTVLTGDAQATFSSAATAAQALFDGHVGDHEVAVVSVGQGTYLFYSSDGGAAADSAVLFQHMSAAMFDAGDFLAA